MKPPRIFIGIDPGLGGAMAVIGETFARVTDTPIFQVGKGSRRDFDIREMSDMLALWNLQGAKDHVHVVLEKVGPRPEQGVTSTFNFGRGYGIWLGLIAGHGFSYTLVTPQDWKRVLCRGMPEGKDSSLQRAKELWPHLAHQMTRKKDHDRAEALLIAEYGRRVLKADESGLPSE